MALTPAACGDALHPQNGHDVASLRGAGFCGAVPAGAEPKVPPGASLSQPETKPASRSGGSARRFQHVLRCRRELCGGVGYGSSLEVGGPEGALRPAARPSCGRGGHTQSGEVPCLSGEAHAESSRPPGVPRGGPEASGPQIRDVCFTRHPDRSRRVFLSLPAACPPEGSKVRAQPTVGPRKQEVGARPGPCLWPQKDQRFPRLPAPRASRDTVTP